MTFRTVPQILIASITCWAFVFQPAVSADLDAAADDIARPRAGSFSEVFQSRRPVGGQILSGFQILPEARGAAGTPGVRTKDVVSYDALCVRVLSRDGRYEFSGTVDLPTRRNAGTISLGGLPVDTEAQTFVRNLAGEDLGVRVRAQACDAAHPGPLVPAVWTTADPGKAVFMITGLGADTVFVSVWPEGGTARNLDCRRSLQDRSAGFDFWCDIPDDVPSGLARITAVPVMRGEPRGAFRSEAILP